MPKMKTKKAAAKRYKVTGSGKAKVAAAGRRHLLSNKSRKRKRQARGMKVADKTKQYLMKSVMPYA